MGCIRYFVTLVQNLLVLALPLPLQVCASPKKKKKQVSTSVRQEMHIEAKKTQNISNRGPRLTPGGLRPQHPQRGATGVGNAQQHGTQVAARVEIEAKQARAALSCLNATWGLQMRLFEMSF
jgi:hypothetical protein